MRIVKLLNLLLFTNLGFLNGQVKTFDFKKGEVMDIILFTKNPKSGEALEHYFKTAIPIAIKMGYEPQKGFTVPESPTAGNYHPESLVIGKWSSLEGRHAALEKLETDLPTFHQQRREIWLNFDLTYYDLKRDVKFEVDPNRHNVAVSIWSATDISKDFRKVVRKSGGSVLLELADGKSPFGYHYDPDYFAILSWEKKEDFLKYQKQFSKLDANDLIHINEFRVK